MAFNVLESVNSIQWNYLLHKKFYVYKDYAFTLIAISEAMAKDLRRAAEGKALAQAEAT